MRPRELRRRRATMPACSHLVPRHSLLPPSSRPLPTDQRYGGLLLLERSHYPSRAAVPARPRARGLRCRAPGRAQPKNWTQAPVRCQRPPFRCALTRWLRGAVFLLPCFPRHHRCRVSLLPTHGLPTPFVPWLLVPHAPLRRRPYDNTRHAPPADHVASGSGLEQPHHQPTDVQVPSRSRSPSRSPSPCPDPSPSPSRSPSPLS